MMSGKKKRKKGKRYNPHCLLISPVQKGFPITDFVVTGDEDFIFTGNAFGCVAAYEIPTMESVEEKAEDEPFLCYQLQKYANAAVRHLWIQTDVDTKVQRVYALIGFQLICVWQLEDIVSTANAAKNGSKSKPRRHTISSIFQSRTTDMYSVRHKGFVALFSSGYEEMTYLDCSREHVKHGRKPTCYKFPPKAEVVSFDGNTYCILEINMKTGLRNLVFKDARTFKDRGNLCFPKIGRNYNCFQLVGTRLAYCSNNNVVKIYDIEKSVVLWRLKGHRGYILAIHFTGTAVVSLGTDRKLKLWENGKCVRTWKNIPGVFNPGYLYKVYYKGKTIYYSDDNGLYVVYCYPDP